MVDDIYRFVVQALQPHTFLHLAAVAAVALVWRQKPELRKRLLWLAVPLAALTVISLPVVAHFALGSLEWQYPPSLDRPPNAQAIVVLNAGIHYADGVRPRAELDTDTMLRCVHAAELYRRGSPLPVVVTGGPEKPGGPGPSCAAVMRDFLRSLGVAETDILVEDRSRTTFENACQCRRILEAQGIRSIALVTDAAHMQRSLHCFLHQGLDAAPSACRHGATRLMLTPESFLPNPSAAQSCRRVFHEWMGLAWYKIKGRI